jgi:hypothetical protein
MILYDDDDDDDDDDDEVCDGSILIYFYIFTATRF